MNVKIALAGNPNSGKTTLFNALTGSNQFVGNWPGVTVEKDPAPFVMELPAYHLPTAGNVLRSTWERGWSFIKKAGTIILLSTICIWFAQDFGFENGSFGMVEDMNHSILAAVGSAITWMFTPLGWGDWKAAVAAITGLVAKENVVGTFGILYGFGEVAEDGVEIWRRIYTDRGIFVPRVQPAVCPLLCCNGSQLTRHQRIICQ